MKSNAKNQIKRFRIYLGMYLCISLLFVSNVFSQEIKWHPGHYIFGADGLTEFMGELNTSPILLGVQKRYYWDTFEPVKDSYDFSTVINDLNYMHDHGKYLIIQIQLKTFSDNQGIRFPGYINTPEYDSGYYHTEFGGYNLAMWNDNIRIRLASLISALGAALDEHPALALVNISESAQEDPSEGKPEGWGTKVNSAMQNLASLGSPLRTSFPKTPTVQYFNHPREQYSYFENSCLVSGNGHGGPDVMANYPIVPQGNATYEMAYRLKGLVPICYSVQWSNYEKDYNGTREVPPSEHLLAAHLVGTNFLTWGIRNPYWTNVKSLFQELLLEGDPSGGLHKSIPSMLNPNPETLPEPATGPSPSMDATEIVLSPTLSWFAGNGTVNHKVYFGTSPSPSLVSTQPGTVYLTGVLINNTKYYWKIDEYNEKGIAEGEIWSFTTIAQEPSANLITNPGFELETDSWESAQRISEPGYYNSGSWAGRMHNPNQAYKYGRKNIIGLLPNTSYTLSGFIKTENIVGGSGARIEILFFNESGGYKAFNTPRVLGSVDFKEYSTTLISPESFTYAQVRLAMTNCTGTAWFDDLSLIKSPALNTEQVPDGLKNKMLQLYPNPASSEFFIEFETSEKTDVKLEVFNSIGREIKTLLDKNLESGKYKESFNLEDYPNGLYYVRLITGNQMNIKCFALIK